MRPVWFRPMAAGQGFGPANWRGWAALAGFTAALVALGAVVFGPLAGALGGPLWAGVVFMALAAGLAVGFLILARSRTAP